MKKFKFLAMAVTMAFVSLPMISCGDDEDDNKNGVPTPSVVKQLVSLTTESFNYGEKRWRTDYTNFKYDNAGRIVSYTIDSDGDIGSVSYTYSSNSIIYNSPFYYRSSMRYTLENGMISFNSIGSSSSEMYGRYEYIDKMLTKYRSSDDYAEFIWENGVKQINYVEMDYNQYRINYTYTTKPCYDTIVYLDNTETPYYYCNVEYYPFFANAGYLGKNMTPFLIDKIEIEDLSDSDYSGYKFDYELDSDGYVSKMTVSGFGSMGFYNETYTFVWK